MKTNHYIYIAAMMKQGKWWVGWIGEVPGVNCQECSRAELIKSLRVTLKES